MKRLGVALLMLAACSSDPETRVMSVQLDAATEATTDVATPEASESDAQESGADALSDVTDAAQEDAGPDATHDALEDGEAGGDGGADTADAIETDAAVVCPSDGGAMVRVPEGYCIDVFEVTASVYAEWLSHTPTPDATNQPGECVWNTTFGIDPACSHCEAVTCPDRPVVCVDWCDAWGYCNAHGKRLCGQFPGGAPEADSPSNSQTEWGRACMSGVGVGGNNGFVYGHTYSSGKCNDLESGHGELEDVGSEVSCKASDPAFADLRDMNGNAAEWVNRCAWGGEDALCGHRGGSYKTNGAETGCVFPTTQIAPRNTRASDIGFRCCAD
jgi:hypothetical protein